MSCTFTGQDGYLFVKVQPPWTFEIAIDVIDISKQAAIDQGYERILVDLREWVRPDMEVTRYLSGEYLAKQLPPPFKISAFAVPQAINKLGENTAANRGANFRIFKDESEALDWLLSENHHAWSTPQTPL